jgi:hypothetical protein
MTGHLEHAEHIGPRSVQQEPHAMGLLPLAAGHLELGVDSSAGAPVRLDCIIRPSGDPVGRLAQHSQPLVGPSFVAQRAIKRVVEVDDGSGRTLHDPRVSCAPAPARM